MAPQSPYRPRDNTDLITGTYNYCDRWCERCPLTSRCLVYASENESSESNDIRNADFWRTLSASLTEARELNFQDGPSRQAWTSTSPLKKTSLDAKDVSLTTIH